MFPNCIFQLYCPKDYYKKKQWKTAGDNDHEFVSLTMVIAMPMAWH